MKYLESSVLFWQKWMLILLTDIKVIYLRFYKIEFENIVDLGKYELNDTLNSFLEFLSFEYLVFK